MIFKDTEIRIQSMAMLHEALYQSTDLERISPKDYIHKLATQILETYGIAPKQINLNVNVEDVDFTIDTAIPCGLIINELMTNSLKHAFHDTNRGEIAILLHSRPENELELVIEDSGQGMDFNGIRTLGLNLVGAFVKRLRGQMSMNNRDGTEFRIVFRNEVTRRG